MNESQHILGKPIWRRVNEAGSARQLALFRIMIGLFCLTYFLRPINGYLDFIEAEPRHYLETFIQGPLFDVLNSHVSKLRVAGLIGAVGMMLGLFTRVSIGVTLLCFLVVCNRFFLVAQSHTDWPYLPFFCSVLLFAPCNRVWAVDTWLFRKPGQGPILFWPIAMCIAWMGLIYLGAGIQKVFPLRKGWYWLQGYTTQDLAMERIFDSPIYWLFGRPLFDYAGQLWVFAILSTFAVIIELAGVFWILGSRFQLLLYVLIGSLHIGMYLFSIPGFIVLYSFCLVLFLPPKIFGDVAKES